MTLKDCLKKTLATTMALSFALAPVVGQAQSLNPQDPASLLISSLNARTPEEARALIEQARALLPRENLSASDLAAMNAFIDQAVQTVNSRPSTPASYAGGEGGVPDSSTNPSIPPMLQPNSSSGADSADVLKALLSSSPAIQAGLRSLGEMRLLRDSANVSENVFTLTGQPPQVYDQREINDVNQANQPGEILAYLKSKGLIRSDFSADNKALLDQFKGASLDVVADKIIARSIRSSTIAGATRAVINVLGQNLGRTGGLIQMAGTVGGITVESAATFIINANLTLQIADLYGIRLNSYEEEVAVLAVFAMAKIGVGAGVDGPDFQKLVDKVSARFADARLKIPGNSGFNFLGHLLQNPLVARNLKNSGLIMPVAPGAGAPVQPGTVTPPTPPAPGAPPAPAPVPTEPKGPAAPGEAGKTPIKGMARARALIRSLVTTVLQVGFASAWANVETRAVGFVAKRTFRSTHQRERATQNDLFRQYLLSPGGDGFFKLMILSVNVGKPMEIPDDFQTPRDARVKMILNLARSARICSPLDGKQWQSVKSGQANLKSSAVQNRILRYDCDTQLSQARYLRIKTEFETFNEIPQDFITALRTAPREDRLRMGELLLQMQFLDGDRSPSEVKYFNDVASKYLGLSSPDDMDYFSRLHSFIVDNGGMVEALGSPSGFTIGSNTSINPYDLNLGYTPTRGPESMTPLIAPVPAPLVVPTTPPAPGTTPATPPATTPGTTPGVPPGNTGVTPGAPPHAPLNPGQNPYPGPIIGPLLIPSLNSYYGKPG